MGFFDRLRNIMASRNNKPIAVDRRNLPIGYGTTVVADEFGNSWELSSPHEEYFGYGMVLIDDPSALDDILLHTEGNVYVVVDRHTSYGDKLTGRIVAHSGSGRFVDENQYDSHRVSSLGNFRPWIMPPMPSAEGTSSTIHQGSTSWGPG